MDSGINLILQLNGVIIIAVLCLLLGKSLRQTALKYWTIAWLSLSFSLICLRLAISFEVFAPLLTTYFYLGQYIFGFLVVAGCIGLDTGWELRPRTEIWFAPFLIAAILLPLVSTDVNELYPFHCLILAGFFTAAFVISARSDRNTFGRKLMHIALGALLLDMLLYSAAIIACREQAIDSTILAYNSIIELVLQTSLGMGMVLVLLEKVLTEAESAHERLQDANRKLEQLVHTDPLTAAFNRHAFYGFIKKQGDENSETSGCVGFFDIDDLKGINDRYGHTVGDMAIRCVVKGIREIVRAEDLIFRWGGDEFFVVMISMDAEMAMMRMTRLEAMLSNVSVEGVEHPIDISVSWGFTDFADISGLEAAINEADAAMYLRKQERKRLKNEVLRLRTDFGKADNAIAT
ncbi:MAG: GGDEF domain-containing protein [Pyrinomonadaceae bacterium]